MLVTAPLDVRVEIVRAKHGMTTHDASAFVRKRQHERERFYTRYSNGKWDMYTDKDLVVDRSVFRARGRGQNHRRGVPPQGGAARQGVAGGNDNTALD